ncbi:TPA: hypothetical protein NJV04_002268 [Corynebacterium striatum]|nr:hypothetical protein [Corynebacterium striatum]
MSPSRTDDSVSNEVPEESEKSFGKPYVDKLRKESAGYRERAKTAEERATALEDRLLRALVKLDGRLADAEDLPFDESYLDDEEKLSEAITSLLSRKPGLRSRKVSGDVGQGKRGSSKHSAGLIDLIRGV